MIAKSFLLPLAILSMSALAAEKNMPSTPAASAPSGMIEATKTAAAKAGETVMVNLNTATEADLQKIPGLSAENAKEIIGLRPFKSVNDLTKVKGIKQDLLAKIKPYLTVK